MGFPVVYGVMFPVMIFRVVVWILLIKETVLSVVNLLLGRGWVNPSSRTLASGTPTEWLHFEVPETGGPGGSFEVQDATTLAEEIRTSLPAVQFGDIASKLSNEEEIPCAVCLSNFTGDEEVRQTPRCGHVFHKDCLDRWLGHHQTTCPLCRSSLVSERLLEHGNQAMRGDANLASNSTSWFSFHSAGAGRGHWWQTYLQGLSELF